jgi:hypothetical protein
MVKQSKKSNVNRRVESGNCAGKDGREMVLERAESALLKEQNPKSPFKSSNTLISVKNQ